MRLSRLRCSALLLLLALPAGPVPAEERRDPIEAAPGLALADSVTPQLPPGAGGRLTGTGKAFASDLGHVASSPARMNRGSVVWTVGILAAGGVLYAYDEEVLEAFLRSRGDPIYDALLEIGERTESLGHMGKTGPYWVAGAALGTLLRHEPLQSLCLDVIESHLVSGGIRNSAKLFVGRERPFEAGPYSFFKGGTSFPSGHASVVFELAAIFNRHARRAPLGVRIPVAALGYGLAAGVAVQRVDSRGHWPSDVFLAAASGTVIANTVARRNEERRAALTAEAGAAGSPAGVTLRWRF